MNLTTRNTETTITIHYLFFTFQMQQQPVETSISIHAHTMTNPDFNRSDRIDKLKHSISISTIKPPTAERTDTLDDNGTIM